MNYLQNLFKELQPTFEGEILHDEYSRGMYATDASIYQITPQLIVLPKSNEDVKLAIRVANKYKCSILPRGGGTSLAGQTVGNSLVLDFSKHMNKTLEINQDERWVRVQPGKVRDVLNEELASYGLHFAPDPATSSRANVGGMVGNNSSGTKSILYGKTVDHVLEATVLLSDGTIMHLKELSGEEMETKSSGVDREAEIYTSFKNMIDCNQELIKGKFPKVMRSVGGYNLNEFIGKEHWNLAKLITGSEGTLATILELKLNLEPLPKAKSVCVVHYAELLEAIGSVPTILEFGPSAVEILDYNVLDLSRQNLTTQRHCHFIEGNPEAILIVEFYGDSREEVLAKPERMIAQLKKDNIGYAYPLFFEGKAYEDVWVVRKKGLGLMLGMQGNKKPLAFIEDAGIPTQYLKEYIDKTLKICKKHKTEVSMYAHASVGVIHVRPILDLRLADDIQRLKGIAEDTFKLVMQYGGSWSGEHGDGLVRSAFNERFFGKELYNTFIDVKKLFDPDNLMNPGKIVKAPPIGENLRYGINYKDDEVFTKFSYTNEGSFKDAVHMCTGVGECRKIIGGTMCPSFKATRDEEHSTRGRANALRMAMSNQLGENQLASERLKEALSLCLSCKACKSECPSNVDMAKLKSEVMQMYYDKHGIKLRDRLIRKSRDLATKFSGSLSPIINRIQSQTLFKTILDKLVGFDKRRSLPDYSKQSFAKWFNSNEENKFRSGKKVVLFADTYLNFHEPEVGVAAVELLNSCGYEVILANVGCCQRPKLSHGFLKESKKEGLATAMKLKQFFDNGLTVVVCEPSCASALNDDLPDLIDDVNLVKQLRQQVKMIDVFLNEEIKLGNLDKKLTSIVGNIKIHGHCHQKALYGTSAMLDCVEKDGFEISEIPSGCCGMAGSFGYEKEHYQLSKKIGEETLFPAILSDDEGAEIVANGFSCRHQITHFTGVKPKHWVEVVRAIQNDQKP